MAQRRNYNNIISTNPSMFKPGNTIPSETLEEICSIDIDLMRGPQVRNMRLLNSQVQLNRHLAKRGLYLTSQNYYSTFKVITGKKIKPVIEAYRTASLNKSQKAIQLSLGYTNPIKG